MKALPLVICLAWRLLTLAAHSHPGRRFEVQIVDNQLVAQGVITNGMDDGAGLVRPYANVILDHWLNSPVIGVEAASANLPGFDVPASLSELRFQALMLTLTSAAKWENPPHMPHENVVPSLSSLAVDELISVTFDDAAVTTQDPGTLVLSASVPPDGLIDLDPVYAINRRPSDSIYVLEFQLSTTAPTIGPSDPIYIMLSQDGATPVERLHHASLFLEQYLGSGSIPEPSTASLTCAAIMFGLINGSFRRRARGPEKTYRSAHAGGVCRMR